MALRKYQREDLAKWANKNNFRGALMWEPGLGKTFVAIKAIERLITSGKSQRVLVLCPATLVDMWEEDCIKNGIKKEEIFRYKPLIPYQNKSVVELRVECKKYNLSSEGTKGVLRKRLAEAVKDEIIPRKARLDWPEAHHKYLLGSYELFPTLYNSLELTKERIDTFILDESHNIKSHKAKAFKLLQNVVSPQAKVLLLSGTPFPQGRIDVWSQMSLISPGILGKNITRFRERYCKLLDPEFYTYTVEAGHFAEIDSKLYSKCSFRKTTDEIDLPPLTEINLSYKLTKAQQKWYRQIKNDKVLVYKDQEVPLALPGVRMLMLQQVCSGLINMEIEGLDGRVAIKIDIESALNNKEELLLEKLVELPKGEQALIWVNYVKTGEKLVAMLNKKFKKNVAAGVNGSVNGDARTQLLKKYQNKGVRFLVAHPKTLGTGFNIFSKTKYMYWYELTTDFAVFEQANRRIWRIGQENNSFMYIFRGRASIEPHIHKAVREKKNVQEYIYANYLPEELPIEKK